MIRAPGRLRELRHELAADDERLLVGEREVDALAERRDGRAEAGRADERVEDEVGAGLDDEPDEPLRRR